MSDRLIVIIEAETALSLLSSLTEAIEAYEAQGWEVVKERYAATGAEKGFRAELTIRRKP